MGFSGTESARPVIFLAFANDRVEHRRYLRQLPREARDLRQALEAEGVRQLCDLVVRENVTAGEMLAVFRDQRYRGRIAVLHYGGHAGSFQLLLEGEAGSPEAADGTGLAAFLGRQQSLQLVFLNGCSTEAQVQDLLEAGIPSVIATSQAIDDTVATDFAGSFYRDLAGGDTIQTAFDKARAAVQFSRGRNPRDAYCVQEPSTAADRWPWHLALRPGADAAAGWNLPDAAGDPLFGLPPLPDLDLPASPYRYLDWYQREDAELFFGRGREIRDLYERVTAPRSPAVILFYGQAGVGKSSLLAAGLLPRLEHVCGVRYARREQALGLLGTLQQVLAAGGQGPGHPEPPQGAAANPAAGLGALWAAAEAQAGQPVVVLLDQVEEVYTRPAVPAAEIEGDDPTRPGELDQLLAALETVSSGAGSRPQGRLILSFRKEWLAEVERRLATHNLPCSRVFLERLDRLGTVEVVAGPTRSPRLRDHYRLEVEDGLAGLIADDLLADAGSAVAPTLQILLAKMWDQARRRDYEHPVFDRALYDELRAEGLGLDDFLEQQLDALHIRQPEPVDTGLALDLLAYHTTPLGTAEQRTAPDLEATYNHRAEVLPHLVHHCQDLYLLVDPAHNQPDRPSASRLAHDTLAPLIRKRFDESDLPGQRARRILENRAVDWAGDKEGIPLDEADLKVVEAGAAGMRARKLAEERLVQASHAKRTRRQRSRWAWQGVGVLAVLAILLALGVAARQWQAAESRRVEAEQANATAQASEEKALAEAANARQAELDAVISGQKAIEEAQNARNAEATAEARREEALLAQAEAERQARAARLAFSGQLAEKAQVAIDAFPQRALLLAVEALNMTLQTRDPRLPVVEQALRQALSSTGGRGLGGRDTSGYGLSSSVKISPDGHWLATAHGASERPMPSVRLWDLTAPDPSAEPIGLPIYVVTDLCFSADSRWLITTDGSSNQVWDLAAADPARVPLDLGDVIGLAVTSPDSRWLAATEGGVVRLWDLAEPRPANTLRVLRDQEPYIQKLMFSPDSRWLLAFDQDHGQAWDLSTPDPAATASTLSAGTADSPSTEGMAAQDVQLSPDGHWLVIRTERSVAHLWDLTALERSTVAIWSEGRQGPVTDVRISPDSRWLAVVQQGYSMVQLWDLAAPDPFAASTPLDTFADGIAEISFSPDGHWLAAGGLDDTLRLWHLLGGEAVVIVPGQEQWHSQYGYSFHWSADSRWLAWRSSIGEPPTTSLWDLSQERASGTAAVAEGSFEGIDASSRWLVTADGTVANLWDLKSSNPFFQATRLHGHDDSLWGVAFSPNGRWLATASEDSTARLWDLASRATMAAPIPLTDRGEGIVGDAVFSADNRWLALFQWPAVGLWDLSDGSLSARPVLTDAYNIEPQLTISPDSRWLVTAEQCTFRLWDLATPGPALGPVLSHGETCTWQISPDGRWLVASGPGHGARLWDLAAADPAEVSIHLLDPKAHLSLLAIDGQSRWLAIGRGQAIHLWDLKGAPNVPHTLLPSLDGPVDQVSISPDGRWLAAGGGSMAYLWELTAGGPAGQPIVLNGQQVDDLALAFSADARWLMVDRGYSFSSHPASLWDLADPALPSHLMALPDHEGVPRFSPDGRWLVADNGEDGTIFLWDLSAAGQPAAPTVLRDPAAEISVLTFSPDSRWLVSDHQNKAPWLWDLGAPDPTAAPVALSGDLGSIVRAGFSPNSHWLVVGDEKNGFAFYLWDLAALDASVAPVEATRYWDNLTQAVFSPDSRWLLTGSRSGYARLLPLRAEDLVALACTTAGRNLTLDEWEQDFPGQPYHKTCDDLPIDASLLRRGWDLAYKGYVEGAVAQFQLAVDLEPGLDLDPEARAGQIAALPLLSRAQSLARYEGDVEGATALFQDAITLDPSLDLDPETEARQTAAAYFTDQGKLQAERGDVQGAIGHFQRALELDPNLELDPQRDATRFVAQSMVEEARRIAYAAGQDWDAEDGVEALGDLVQLAISEATAQFQRALEMDPSLDLEPEASARSAAAQGLVEMGQERARDDDVIGALLAFEYAQRIEPEVWIAADAWYGLCREGSWWRSTAASVVPACDQAIIMDPGNGLYYDARGLAHALSGDFAAAAKDFGFFLEWGEGWYAHEGLLQRQEWIGQLRQGLDPFDDAVLSHLRGDDDDD